MIAELNIQAGLQNGKTCLKTVFRSQPFKLADITEDRSGKTLRLMIMSSSPGILDGDEYKIRIYLAQGCSVVLETQSFQRLFSMKKGASQNMQVRMDKDSSFVFLPHPSVPHEASVFTSKAKIYLSEQCSLTWGEVLTCGRKLCGESFLFSKYHSITEVFINNKLVVKENLLMAPKLIDVHAMGQLEGYTHQASMILINESLTPSIVTANINELLNEEKEICFGVSSLPVNGIIVRILGYKGEQLHSLLKRIEMLVNHNQILKPLAYAK